MGEMLGDGRCGADRTYLEVYHPLWVALPCAWGLMTIRMDRDLPTPWLSWRRQVRMSFLGPLRGEGRSTCWGFQGAVIERSPA
jgi:hypothetical protein